MDEISFNDKLKYLLDVDGRILESIQFADRKSHIYLTASGAILAFLIKFYPVSKICLQAPWTGSEVLILLAYLTTAFSIILLSCVIWPKGFRPTSSSGYFDPLRIAGFGCSDCYRRSYLEADHSRLIGDICALVFDRSRTNDRKYKWLKRGLVLTYCSWAIAAVLFAKFPTGSGCIF